MSPYKNGIELLVNDVKLETGFTYDAASRSIKFDADSLPVEGSEIEIRYKVQVNTVVGAL